MRLCRGSRFKVESRRSKAGQGYFLHQTSFFEHPPSPSTLKGLHLSLVFSPLRGKKTAPPVAQRSGLEFLGGFAAVQGSKFSDLKVQSDPRVDDKVQGGGDALNSIFN